MEIPSPYPFPADEKKKKEHGATGVVLSMEEGGGRVVINGHRREIPPIPPSHTHTDVQKRQ
jgi:hypothetical protein